MLNDADVAPGARGAARLRPTPFPVGLFAPEDYLRVFTLFMAEREALDTVVRLLQHIKGKPGKPRPAPAEAADESEAPEAPEGGARVFHPSPYADLTGDTLVLLSLLSEDHQLRAEQYRAWLREEQVRADPEADALWEEQDRCWLERRVTIAAQLKANGKTL
jgi:hypothetical protein